MTAQELATRRDRSATLLHVLRSRILTDEEIRFLKVLVDQAGKISNNQLKELNQMAERHHITYEQ